MKICTKCKNDLPLNSFAPRKDRNGHLHSWCEDCRKKRFDLVVKARQKKQAYVDGIKRERGCCVCGFNEPVALDFHHVDSSTKTKTIANMYASHSPLSVILEEIEKCVLFCANHHRLYHAGLIDI